MNQQQNLDHVFFPVSKAVIIIPIAILLLAIIFKIYDNATLSYKKAMIRPTPRVIQQKENVNQINLDLKGPFKCASQDNNIVVYIKDKKVYSANNLDNKNDKFLLNGDCIYRWEKNTGGKTCGISQYMGLYDTMAAFGAINSDLITKFLTSSGIMPASREAALQEVINSCKKEDFEDSVFTVPKNVIFKDEDAMSDFKKITQ